VTSPADGIEDRIFGLAQDLHERREKEVGTEPMRSLERFLLLQKIDEKWKDHLHGMDQLRGSIGMRGYSQLDPKIEYKKEGFELFRVMMSSIQDEVTNLLFRVRLVTPEEEAALVGRVWPKQQAQQHAPAPQVHGPMPPQVATVGGGGGVSFDPQGPTVTRPERPAGPPLDAEQQAAQEGAAAAARAAERARVASQRTRPTSGAQPRPKTDAKVGRNDPCPCGSGKKYKKCHGETAA
jgi:preprotein translocase subunit SecA